MQSIYDGFPASSYAAYRWDAICNYSRKPDHTWPFYTLRNTQAGRSLAHNLCENSLMSWNARTHWGMLIDDVTKVKITVWWYSNRRPTDNSAFCLTSWSCFKCQTQADWGSFGVLQRETRLCLPSNWLREDADLCCVTFAVYSARAFCIRSKREGATSSSAARHECKCYVAPCYFPTYKFFHCILW